MPKPTPLRDQILAYLAEHGPSTVANLAYACEVTPSSIHDSLGPMYRLDLIEKAGRAKTAGKNSGRPPDLIKLVD